ncbi:MAG: hypothetical protein JXN59_16275 [Anaerolineae bacterium]|nr:hypothetical protein [Anaerolineae bacterium]
MPITISWDTEEKKAIRYDFVGEWTWPEFREAVQQTFALMDTVPHTVASIGNFTESGSLPSGAIFELKQVLSNTPPNSGVVVITRGSMFVNTIIQVFTKAYKDLGKKIAVTDTLEEAREIVEKNA